MLLNSRREDPYGLLCVLVLALIRTHSLASRGFVTCIGSIIAFSAQEQEQCIPWSTVSGTATHPTRLSGLLPFLHLLSGCGAIASACSPLARGQKPAGSPEAGKHRGLRLSQPPVPKQVLWLWLAIDPLTKILPVLQLGPRTQNAAHLLIHSLRQLLAPDCLPIFTSDGLNVYFYALTAHFGHWLSVSHRGRKASQWRVAAGLIYGQVKKAILKIRLKSAP